MKNKTLKCVLSAVLCLVVVMTGIYLPKAALSTGVSAESFSENYALASNGNTYTIKRVSNTISDPEFLQKYPDYEFTKLTDGVTKPGEAEENVGLTGTGAEHVIEFDLGQERTFNKIVLRDMINSTNDFGKRGYDISAFKVTSDGKDVIINAKDELNGEAYSYDVTLTFDALTTKNVCVYVTTSVSAYILSLDEVEITYDDTVTPPETTVPEPEYFHRVPEHATENYALASLGASYTIVRLDADGNELEPEYFDQESSDDGFTKLNDGFIGQNPFILSTQAVLVLSKNPVLIKFDLGQKRSLKYIVLYKFCSAVSILSVQRPLPTVSVSIDGKEIETTVAYPVSKDGSYDDAVFSFEEVEGRYVTISLSVPYRFVVQLDEIEMYGSAEDAGPDVTEPQIIAGDVNGDGEVDSADAAILLKYDAGSADLPAEYLSAADVNGDGEVDSADAAILLKYDAGIIDSVN